MPRNSARSRLLSLLVLLSLAGLSCARADSADNAPLGSITRVDGSVDLIRNGDSVRAQPDARLFEGDVVAVRDSGVVEFTLGGEPGFELLRGAAELGAPDRLALEDATLLITTENVVGLRVGDFDLAFRQGSVRVDLAGSGRIAAYDTEGLEVTAGTRTIPVPRLWEVAIGEGGEFGQARPLQFSRDDPLDVRFLAHALDIDGRLGNLIRGSEPQLAAVEAGAFQSRLTAAGIDMSVLEPFANVARSDLLMGLTFARTWKAPDPAALVEGFEQAMALRVLGATWGLAAQIFGVDGDALVAAFQEEVQAALFPTGAGQGGGLVPSTSPSLRPAPGPAPPAAPAPPAPVAPAPAPVPSPSAPPGLLEPVLDPLRPLLPDELEAIIDELYGLVGGVLPIL